MIEIRKYGEKAKSERPAALIAEESAINEVCPEDAGEILSRLRRSNINKLDEVDGLSVITLTYPAFLEVGLLRLGFLTDFQKTAYLLLPRRDAHSEKALCPATTSIERSTSASCLQPEKTDAPMVSPVLGASRLISLSLLQPANTESCMIISEDGSVTFVRLVQP